MINNQPIIHKIYSNFTFLYYPFEIINKNVINYKNLPDFLKRSDLITYFYTKLSQNIEFSQNFNEQENREQYKPLKNIINTTIFIQSYCILLNCSDITQLTQTLDETKSTLIYCAD